MGLFVTSMRTAGRRMRVHPLRTCLTLAQVLLGTLAMTLALSMMLTPTARDDSKFTLVSGIRKVNGSEITAPLFAAHDLGQLRDLAPAVDHLALFETRGGAEVVLNGRRYAFRDAAVISPDYFQIIGLEPTRGTLFSSGDAAQGEPVVVMSDAAATILFGDADPVGQELTEMAYGIEEGGIEDVDIEEGSVEEGEGETERARAPTPTRYRVIGTFTYANTGANETSPSTFDQPPLYFPSWAPGSDYGYVGAAGVSSTHLYVRAKEGRGEEARAQVTAAAQRVYRERPQGDADPAMTLGQDFFVQEVGEAFGPRGVDPLTLIFALFGVVALIAGSIGIFSNTLVDVAQRRQEIGLRRALGASSGRVAAEFMVEASVLASLGATLGIGVTASLLPLLSRWMVRNLFLDTQPAFQPGAAFIVLSVVILVGGVLGLIPAAQTGRLRPSEALQEG